MKYAIIGTAGSGRKTLLHALTDIGFQPLIFHTRHTTKTELQKANALIVDIDQLTELSELLPDESIHVIHVTPDDESKRRSYAALTLTENEIESENERYRKCDDLYKSELPENITAIHRYENDYTMEGCIVYAKCIQSHTRMHKNLQIIIEQNIASGNLVSKKTGTVEIFMEDKKTNVPCWKTKPLDIFTDIVASDKEGLIAIFDAWLTTNLATMQLAAITDVHVEHEMDTKNEA